VTCFKIRLSGSMVVSHNSSEFISPRPLYRCIEALIFAFLGVLKWRGDVNVWKSVTGSKEDHISGVIFKA